MNGVQWQPVLKVMYEGGGFVEDNDREGEYDFEIHTPLSEESTGLNRTEIEHGLRYLDHHNLIEEFEEGYELTETGLQVAQERASQSRQNRINRTIMLAAIVTALSSVLSHWPPKTRLIPIPRFGDGILVGAGIVFAFVVLLYLTKEFYHLEVEDTVSRIWERVEAITTDRQSEPPANEE